MRLPLVVVVVVVVVLTEITSSFDMYNSSPTQYAYMQMCISPAAPPVG